MLDRPATYLCCMISMVAMVAVDIDEWTLGLPAVSGALGVIWYFIWLILVYERPSKHPTISQDEWKTMETKQGEAAIIYEVERQCCTYSIEQPV